MNTAQVISTRYKDFISYLDKSKYAREHSCKHDLEFIKLTFATEKGPESWDKISKGNINNLYKEERMRWYKRQWKVEDVRKFAFCELRPIYTLRFVGPICRPR